MKVQNKFLSAAIIGVVSTVMSRIISRIIFLILGYVGYIPIVSAVVIAVANIISVVIGFVVYHKVIVKTKMHITRVILFSVPIAIIVAFLNRIITAYTSLIFYDVVVKDMHLQGLIWNIIGYYVVAFVFVFIGSLLIIAKRLSEIKEESLSDEISKSKSSKKYYPSFVFIVAVGYIIFTATFICIIGFIQEWDLDVGMVIALVIFSMLFSILYTYIYFLPYLIANKKQHLQKRAIYILNIFAGWTIVAWIIALIWACTEHKEKVVINQTVLSSDADELKKYKELLDDGIITQEEFDAKKKQLLGL